MTHKTRTTRCWPLATTLLAAPLLAAPLLARGSAAGSPAPTAQGPEAHTRAAAQEPLAREFAEWKLAAATVAPAGQSLAALRGLQHKVFASVALQPENEPLRGLANEIEERLLELSPQDDAKQTTPKPTRAEELVVAEAVVAAVRTGDADLLAQLGQRAVPALTSLAVSFDGTTIPKGQLNPLDQLFYIDAAAGLDAALALMESGDVLKKGFAAATLESEKKLGKDRVWTPVGATDWAFVKEGWNRILPAAFEEPALPAKNLVGSLAAVARRGQLPSSLEDLAFGYGVAIGRMEVMPEAGRAFFIRMLDHPTEGLRGSSFEMLSGSADPDPIFRLASAKSYFLRMGVAELLQRRTAFSYADRSTGQVVRTAVPMEMTDAYRAAFVTLSSDETSVVAWRAIDSATQNVLDQAKPLLDAHQLREVLAGIDPHAASDQHSALVRALRQVSVLPVEERLSAVLYGMDLIQREGELDRRGQSQVEQLMYLPYWGLATSSDFRTVVEGLDERGLLTEDMRSTVQHHADNLIESGAMTGAEYVRLAARIGGERLWSSTARKSKTEGVTLGPWCAGTSSADRALAIREIGTYENLSYVLKYLEGGHLAIGPDDLAAVIRDETAASRARLWAAHEYLVQHADRLSSDVMAAMVAAYAVGITDADHTSRKGLELRTMLDRLASLGRTDEFIRGLMADRRSSVPMLHRMDVDSVEAATAEAILERFPPETWATAFDRSNPVEAAIEAIVDGTEGALDPRLEQANIRGSRLQVILASAIGRSRAPVLFPLLDRVLANTTPDKASWSTAIQAASGYFNDEAAALLLRAAREATTSKDRQIAMDALQQMTDWREAAAAWERSAGAAAKRDVAIAGLVALAEDSDQPALVRAEALKGLGLLDAAEELPRLVRALTSEEPPIAEAARAALDRMNSTERR